MLGKLNRRLLGWRAPIVDATGCTVDAPGMLRSLPYWTGPSPVIRLPVEFLVMHGGLQFADPQHPFRLALSHGADSLRDFYGRHCPADLAAMYGLAAGRPGAALPPWSLPWLGGPGAPPPKAEKGLAAEHGTSYYGPCSEAKIKLELGRLRGVAGSIRARGYRPGWRGHVEGFFLDDGRRLKFFVRGGKHRTAALVHLGHAQVPVRMRDTWPRVIRRDRVDDWPAVYDGTIDRQLA
ncbi:MAG: hypothetical protein ACNA7E_04885, partial [Wenzhouxiangellaceae bacterium]